MLVSGQWGPLVRAFYLDIREDVRRELKISANTKEENCTHRLTVQFKGSAGFTGAAAKQLLQNYSIYGHLSATKLPRAACDKVHEFGH